MKEASVLVLGGGIAGVTAAWELARAGIGVTLAEKKDFLGGHAAKLACKATSQCHKCNACLAEARWPEILGQAGLNIMRRTSLLAWRKIETDFQARLRQRPAYIDQDRCTACGLCLGKCPAVAEGALLRPRLAAERPSLAINPEACLYFRDGRSTLCRDICPEEAIDFAQEPREVEAAFQALVVATGFSPYPAGEKERLGHGRVPNVITALELEEMLKERGAPSRPSDGQAPQRVAFIQCVGSRETRGHNYCSRVCCGYALRLGGLLKERHAAQVSVFYMDLQNFGRLPDESLAKARDDMDLVRCMPYDVTPGPGGQVRVEYQAQPGQAPLRRSFDLLVLSVGMAPARGNPELAGLLGLSLDRHGFLQPGQGVFLAGAAAGPLDVAESVASAKRAAQQTLRYLETS